MSANLSEEVTGLAEDCDLLLSAIDEQGPEVEAAALDLVRSGGTEVPPDVQLLATFQTFGQQLRTTMQRLVASDLELHDVETERSLAIRRRTALVSRLGDRLIALRQNVLSGYPDPDLHSLGLAAPVPRRAAKFLRRVELAWKKLTGPAAGELLGEKRFAASQPPVDQAAELAPDIGELRQVLDLLRRLKRRGDSVRARRKEHKADHGRFFVRTGRMFEDFCRFASKDDLAERVRPSASRPGRLVGETDGETGASTDDVPSDDTP